LLNVRRGKPAIISTALVSAALVSGNIASDKDEPKEKPMLPGQQ